MHSSPSQAFKFQNWSKLPGEYPKGDQLQIGFFIGFMIVWITDTILHGTTWLNQFVPLNYRLAGSIFCFIVAYSLLRRSEADLFFRPKHYAYPVYHGIYRYCRHPMYLGDILFHVGFGILSMSMAAWGMIALSILLYRFLCNYEEQASIQKFGEKYILYMKIVPRWIPKLKFFIAHPLYEIPLFQD